VPAARLRPTLGAWHGVSFGNLRWPASAVRQQALDVLLVCLVDQGGLAQVALPLRGHVGVDVAQEAAAPLHLAFRSEREALRRRAIGLHLGHGSPSFTSPRASWTSAGLPSARAARPARRPTPCRRCDPAWRVPARDA